ncbi:MAG: L-glutamate gamma-semialdehyde dehydrogenase [Spirochaetaceae bacterium]|nr:MAG: L-glutamate gamma-semialdehyde dehydrogenase [Spirochaetaceae bacterium]
MGNAICNLSLPINEPVKSYAPGTAERQEVKAALSELKSQEIEIPLIIGGREIKTGKLGKCILPHDHRRVIGTYHQAGKREVQMAIDAALKARGDWAALPWADRAAVFLKAADLISGPWRATFNAANMLAQSKNIFQAEIDSACELIDFFRFNAYYATQILAQQPPCSPHPTWNRMEYRALEGFVFAVTPFNFVSIAGNLPSAPAVMGNVAVWKPASSAVFSAYYLMKLFQEAGLPEGVINFIPGPGAEIGPLVMNSPELAGVHFTGSTETFRQMWQTLGKNIQHYRSYPRIVGETGGKDFIFAHRSTDLQALGVALIRGAFEYQGQKCSAVSRAYIPRGLWEDLKVYLIEELNTVTVGDVEDFGAFMNAVIDRTAFDKISTYIDYAKKADRASIVYGGECDDRRGFFIRPAVVLTDDPHFRTMQEEIFGPVLTIYLYDEDRYVETLELCDKTSPYALTGAIFARDRQAVAVAQQKLENAAGNFYINDKPTGAVVGQQPFGGARASGTNDKAGSLWNLLRWASPRAIKENFVPSRDYRYPFMEAES